MSVNDSLSELGAALGAGAVTALIGIGQQALKSKDPERYLKRLATANAAHAAAQETVAAALKKTKTKKKTR